MTQFRTVGFHHVTLVAADARRSLRFYRDLLGLRLLEQVIHPDDPGAYHLYLSTGTGEPGTLVTFFEWPDAAKGQWGVGGVHHVALGVATADAQLKWKRWLREHGVGVSGPFNRGYFRSIYFRDPDGHILEIATAGPGYTLDEAADALGRKDVSPPGAELRGFRDDTAIAARIHAEPVTGLTPDMALQGIHHVSAVTDDLEQAGEFLESTLGLRLVKRTFNQDAPETRHWFWARYDGVTVAPHSAFSLFGWPGSDFRARGGVGQAHHVAFRVEDAEVQLAWRERIESLGIGVTPVVDRGFFRSIYFSAPDGLLFELSTDTPGFVEAMALDGAADQKS